MSNDDIVSKVKQDNVLAQRFACGGCGKTLAQVPGFSLVPIKGKKRGSEDTEAKGFLCDDCQKDPQRSKEGPRQAVYLDNNGDVRIDFFDNLVDLEPTVAGTIAAEGGTEVTKEGKKKA